MFKNLKLKLASARVKKADKEMSAAKAASEKRTPIAKLKNKIVLATRAIKRGGKKFHTWVRSLDMIGMINTTMLVAIIVLFSSLILNVVNHNKKSDVMIAQNAEHAELIELPEFESGTAFPTPDITKTVVMNRRNKPLLQNEKPVKIVVHNQPTVLNGDIIIDGDFPGPKLSNGTVVNGNLYLQNMHKYNLPCGVYVDGDLILRDVGMLRFAGRFVVTGNIYVSRNSSFGPLPKTARLDGQVIF